MTAAITWGLLVLGYGASTIALVRQSRSVPPRGHLVPIARRAVFWHRHVPFRGAVQTT
jgi:hypothetical protein